MDDLQSVEFEVFGKVQGVYFRKFTAAKAKELGVRGWVRNTPTGTVEGKLQGPGKVLTPMKRWLQTVGSPKSRIDKAVFKNQHSIPILSYNTFQVKY